MSPKSNQLAFLLLRYFNADFLVYPPAVINGLGAHMRRIKSLEGSGWLVDLLRLRNVVLLRAVGRAFRVLQNHLQRLRDLQSKFTPLLDTPSKRIRALITHILQELVDQVSFSLWISTPSNLVRVDLGTVSSCGIERDWVNSGIGGGPTRVMLSASRPESWAARPIATIWE
ncbi:hypothetical protein BDQ17DRAFT_1329020 [Cyathus striatus]|nr:hypothetical protein BDQ17DRAFT_1329020 [Cyathus striatus]